MSNNEPSKLDRLLSQAAVAHQAGQLGQAEQCYQQALIISPTHAHTLQQLGILKYMQGNFKEAIALINKAIKEKPQQANYYLSLGIIYGKLNQHEQAKKAYLQATHLKPDYAEAWNNLGLTYVQLKQFQKAYDCYHNATHAQSNYAAAYYNHGLLLGQQGKFQQGINALQQAHQLVPNNAEILNTLASQLSEIADFKNAQKLLQQSLTLNPNDFTARLQLGEVYFLQHRFDMAEKLFRTMLAQPAEIAKQAMNGLARVLAHSGKMDEAADYYEKSLTLDPNYLLARENLLFMLSYNAMRTPRAVMAAHLEWNKVIDGDNKMATFSWPRKTDQPNSSRKKLKIAYISADFRFHPVAYLIEPVLRNHDHEHFEIYCYSNVISPDAVTQRLKSVVNHWHSVIDLDDQALAKKIHEDGIDLLIDLSGHTAGNRLKALAYRPAPIQATYLGYCSTTGLSSMDYWITDTNLHPENTEEVASEEIFRLPRCWITYQPPNNAPEISIKNNDPVCFGSFNAISKISSQTLATWSAILEAVDQSIIFLKCRELGDDNIRESVIEYFANHGITKDRIKLETAEKDYLKSYHHVDIALDPFPRTGGATTLDALWMGVPVITLGGKRFIERQGLSILTALGHPEWIAASQQDYIDKAVKLARQKDLRDKIRQTLRIEFKQSTLADGKSLANALETAYLKMWKNYLKNNAEV